jgi:hypothetical protein
VDFLNQHQLIYIPTSVEMYPINLDRMVHILGLDSKVVRERKTKRCSWYSTTIISRERHSSEFGSEVLSSHPSTDISFRFPESAFHVYIPPTQLFTSHPRSSRPLPTHSLRPSHIRQTLPLPPPLSHHRHSLRLQDSYCLYSLRPSISVRMISLKRHLD